MEVYVKPRSLANFRASLEVAYLYFYKSDYILYYSCNFAQNPNVCISIFRGRQRNHSKGIWRPVYYTVIQKLFTVMYYLISVRFRNRSRRCPFSASWSVAKDGMRRARGQQELVSGVCQACNVEKTLFLGKQPCIYSSCSVQNHMLRHARFLLPRADWGNVHCFPAGLFSVHRSRS